MRFSTIIFPAVTVLLVSAQSATDASSTIAPAVRGTAVASAAETSEAACLAACDKNDVNCAAACVAGDVMVNGIAECQSNCVQGDGSAPANLAYKNCLTACEMIAESISSIVAGSTLTGTQAVGSSSTSVAPASTTSKAGGSSNIENVRVGASLAGVVGIVVAVFAL